MLPVAAAVAGVWAVLLGAAYLARGVLGLRRLPSLALVAACYAVLAGIALDIVGWSGRGLLAISGMLVPLAIGCALATMTGRR